MNKLLRKIALIALISGPVLFAAKSQQILEKYCYDCHSDGTDKGDLDFDKLFKMKASDPKTKKLWAKVWEVIEKEQMPPSDKKTQPKSIEREQLMIAIESGAFRIKRNQRYAGKVELVRMSNYQFGNTIASLTGVYGTENELPLDATSAGFDNIGNTLTISPLLFDRYQRVAKRVSFDMLSPDSRNGGAKGRGNALLKRSGDGKDQNKALTELNNFALHAFRRPVNDREKFDIKKLYSSLRKSHDHRDAMRESVRAILVSPSFIFRTEQFGIDKKEGRLGRLDEYALASRLAYFLWSSQPDHRLLDLASKKQLRQNLKKEMERMIRDGRFSKMMHSFGQYWLGIQYLQNNEPNRRIFKSFERYWVHNLKRETTYFLQYMFKENKPVNELFSSRETFIDPDLAKYYGLKQSQKGYKKVKTPDHHNRRGILTQPSVLLVTSDPDRTSVVKRGLWLLENILGMPPPPAPANVAGLEETTKFNKNLTLRQRLEKHREDKKCASCHAMMDPLGFAMENFDATGRWRTKEGGNQIDPKTVWRGDKIDRFDDLYKLITGKYRNKFLKCFSEKLLTYALGRGLEIQDRIAIMQIVEKVKHKDSRLHEVLFAVIESTPFQYRTLE